MKSIYKKLTKLVLVLGVLTIVSFTIYQSPLVEQQKQKIIGIWEIDGDENNKMIFTSNGNCKWEFEGVITDEFTYTIGSEITPNGNEVVFLELVDISDSSLTLGYTINSLNNNKMRLEHDGGFGGKFSEYTKQ